MPLQDLLRAFLRAHFVIGDGLTVSRSGFMAVLSLYLQARGMPPAKWPTPTQVREWMVVQFPVRRSYGKESFVGLGLTLEAPEA